MAVDGSKAEIEGKPAARRAAARRSVISDAAVLATKLPGIASRDGGMLRLKLAGDRTFKLTDCLEGPACDGDRPSACTGWRPGGRPSATVRRLGPADTRAAVGYLVPERDGRALETTAPAVLSPSGRAAVALTSDLMQGVELQLIDLSRDPPTLTKIEEFPACAGADANSILRPKPVWIDDTHVRFEGKSPNPDDKPNTKQLLRLVDGKAAWEC